MTGGSKAALARGIGCVAGRASVWDEAVGKILTGCND
jgi:hypothetical protein